MANKKPKQLDLSIDAFKKFLEASGAQMIAPTNEWELLRFRTDNGVSVVYTNKSGTKTFTNEAQVAWDKFVQGHGWRSVSRKRKYLTDKKKQLAERDGARCFFCETEAPAEELTIEHLLSFSHGGKDNLNNLCLACDDCQDKLGNLPVVQKILLRDELRKAAI